MSEKPILFSGEMVRAMLEGRKTQTRRAVNRLSRFGKITEIGQSETIGYDWKFRNKKMLWNDITHERLMECCPYGKVGDQLWVRETWAKYFPEDDEVFYRADHPGVLDHFMTWKPSIHMRREYSRITLEITGVRVERLQDISEEDAKAEGIKPELDGWVDYSSPYRQICMSASLSYQTLWESINGDRSWDANPWVWVIEFKVVKPNLFYTQEELDAADARAKELAASLRVE